MGIGQSNMPNMDVPVAMQTFVVVVFLKSIV